MSSSLLPRKGKEAESSVEGICKLLQDSKYKRDINKVSELGKTKTEECTVELVENSGKTTPSVKAVEVQTTV